MDIDARLRQIERIAQNSRASWFALLALLVFVGVTLMGHKDSDFFAFDAVTQLPLININVATPLFFAAAPVITGALYIYLHLYLIALWYALAKAPARISEEPLEEHVYPALLCTSTLVIRGWLRREDEKPVEGRGAATVVISALMTWIFGPTILALLWYRSMPYHDGWLTLWILFWLWLSMIAGMVSCFHLVYSMRTGRLWSDQLQRQRRLSVGMSTVLFFALLAAGLGIFSWKKTGGGHVWYSDADLKGSCEYKSSAAGNDEDWISPISANLRGANLTRKQDNWLPYEVWLEDWEERFLNREQLGRSETICSGETSKDLKFRIETKKRWVALTESLDSPNIRYPDLRAADLAFAFLSGSTFLCADMRGVTAHWAKLEGATLRTARIENAYFYRARMEGVDLSYSIARKATLIAARLQGADFSGARMQGIDLKVALLDGADLSGTYMQCAKLNGARMPDVDLSAARLKGANLRSVDLTSARNLTQGQIDVSFGDVSTKLPADLNVPDHWDTAKIEWHERDEVYRKWLKTDVVFDSSDQDDICP